MAIAMLGKSGAAVSIASVGHLDIKDTNSKRHISIAYAKRGQEQVVKTIYLLITCKVVDLQIWK